MMQRAESFIVLRRKPVSVSAFASLASNDILLFTL
jgi:hypothetical protein